MALTEVYTQSALSVSTTELSLTGGTSTLQARTDDGIYLARLWIPSLAAGDKFLAKVYEKLLAGSSQVAWAEFPIENAMATPLEIAPRWLFHGWEWSIVQVAGADRSVDFSLWKAA